MKVPKNSQSNSYKTKNAPRKKHSKKGLSSELEKFYQMDLNISPLKMLPEDENSEDFSKIWTLEVGHNCSAPLPPSPNT